MPAEAAQKTRGTRGQSRRKKKERPVLTPIEFLALLIFGQAALRYIRRLGLERKALEKNLTEHLVRVVSVYFLYGFIAASILVPIAPVLYPILPPPLNIVFLAAGASIVAGFFLAPLIKFGSSSEEANRISSEIIYFSFHLNVLMRSSAPLSEVIRKLSLSQVYPTIAGYIRRAIVYSKLMNHDILTSLEEVARYIPNVTLSSLVTGLVNTLRARSNAADYLTRANALIMEEYKKYLNSVKSLANAIGAVLVMIVMFTMFMNTTQALSIIGTTMMSPPMFMFTNLFVIPITLLVMLLALKSKMPRYIEDSRLPFYSFLATLPAGIGAALGLSKFLPETTTKAGVELGIALLVPSIPAAVLAAKYGGQAVKYLKDFENWLSDLAAERRLGLPLEHIIMSMEYVYGSLNKAIRRLKMAIRTGLPVESAIRIAFSDMRAKTIQFASELLGDAIVYGSATAESLSFMASIIKELGALMDEMRRELRSLAMSPYFMIILQVFSVSWFMDIVKTSFGSIATPGATKVMAKTAAASKMVGAYFSIGTVLMGFIGAFIIGLLMEQRLSAGFKHAVIILVMTLLMFLVRLPIP